MVPARRAGLEMVEKSLTGALWPLPCESPAQQFRAPGQALRTAADLEVRYPLLSAAVPQVPLSRGPSAAHPGSQPPDGLRSVPDPLSNLCSITWIGGDLARPGSGSADRGAAGAVRGAARRRPGHRPRAGRQARAVHPGRRYQDLEPHAAGTAAPARGVRPASRRLPRPPTDPDRWLAIRASVLMSYGAKCYSSFGQAVTTPLRTEPVTMLRRSPGTVR
jgi:hypothetical protein